MSHRVKRLLIMIGLTFIFGFITTFLIVPDLRQAIFAAPLPKFPYPIDSILIISDPNPAEVSVPGQLPEQTLIRDSFVDPDPNWRNYDFDDSAWNPSYLAITQPAWGTPLNDPATLADFIWGGTPGTGDGNGRFEIPATPAPQFLFIRKNFCIPINANLNATLPNTNLRIQTAATLGDISVYFNNLLLINASGGAESDVINYTIPTGATDPFVVGRKKGRNTLAMRVDDERTDANAGVAYDLELSYAIDTTALTMTTSAAPWIVGNSIDFVAVPNDIGLDGPFTYAWDFGDSNSASGQVTAHTYANAGVYTVTLSATDSFGCPSIPIYLPITITPPPLTSVVIAGPSTGLVNTSYNFTATVLPSNAGLPITYTWQATDLPGAVQSNNLQDFINFTWTIPGTKTITVVAYNGTGPVTDTHVIYIQPNALTSIAISGPTMGVTNVPYSFDGAVQPLNASFLIDYVWQADAQAPINNIGTSTYTDTVSFTWGAPGTYVITATANNPAGIPVFDTHVITISPVITPLTSVTINGPSTGVPGVGYPFTADSLTLDATQPITYNWQAVGATAPTATGIGGLSDPQNFTWNTPGVYQLTVVANNIAGIPVTDTHLITISTIITPLLNITLSGPSAGMPGTVYNFTADVLPLDATQPITYLWDSGGGLPANASDFAGGLSNAQGFSWNTPGVYQITVVANNAGNVPVTATHLITISTVITPLNAISLSGPTTGVPGTAYNFIADVLPTDATTPITYTWQAVGATVPTLSNAGGISDGQSFTWNTPGVYVITVVATNLGGVAVTATHTITIDAIIVPLISVTINGASTGFVGTGYSFSAVISPSNATLPITYTWQADGQVGVFTGNGPSYTWNTPGTYVITVTATNAGGIVVVDTHTIVISAIAPTSVAINGPLTGLPSTNYNFTANVAPANTTLPLTYIWTADEQTSVTQADINSVTSPAVSFSWANVGVKTISVTATNAAGSVVGTHQITISVVLILPVSVSISGPTTGNTGQTLTFDATINPSDATTPLTYTWQADEQTSVTQVSNNTTDSVSFTWSTEGVKNISVSVTDVAGKVQASKISGVVADTHQVTITQAIIAPLYVVISGPSSGNVGQTLTFYANLNPSDASPPLTYYWQAGLQTDVTNINNNGVSFIWNTPGVYNITVTVGNGAATVSATFTVTINRVADSGNSDDDDDDDDDAPPPAAPAVQTTAPTPMATIAFPSQLPETGATPLSTPGRFILLGILLSLAGYLIIQHRRYQTH